MRYTLFIIAVTTLIITFSSCNEKKTNQTAEQESLIIDSNDSYGSRSYYDNTDYSSSSNTGFQTATSNSNYVLPQPAVMDDHEDAFEEGASLAEEDRMNGTRSHVGGDYNGYDDEYDDGYDE